MQERILFGRILRLRRVAQAASSTPPQCGPRGAFLFQRKVISYEKQKIPGRISRAIFIQKKDYTTAALQKNGSGHCSFSSFFPAAAFIKLCLSSSIQTVTVGTGLSRISRGFLPQVADYTASGDLHPALKISCLYFSLSVYTQ